MRKIIPLTAPEILRVQEVQSLADSAATEGLAKTSGSVVNKVITDSYALPTAAASTLGGVKIGSGVTITNGVISVSTAYEASGAVATHSALTTGIHGLAITAGQTLTVTTGGTLGSAAYTASGDYATSGHNHTGVYQPAGSYAAALSGTQNEIAYFNTTTTIASLAVASYPSLTEIAYVKGVTSGIQTQLNAKVDVVAGKGLSTNDYDNTAESKLAGIEASADVTDITNIAAAITGADAKTTMTAADKIAIIDSEASNVGKTLSWAYVKSILKTYFDSLYATAPIFKNGSTTRALNGANGAQNIAHGLGVIPKNVRISALLMLSENISISNTAYNGTTQSSHYMMYKVFTGEAVGDIFAIEYSGAGQQVGVVTFDATNIIITWTKNGAPPAGTIYLLWEAIA